MRLTPVALPGKHTDHRQRHHPGLGVDQLQAGGAGQAQGFLHGSRVDWLGGCAEDLPGKVAEPGDPQPLHRCLHRHGISRLPDVEGDKEPKKTFKSCPIGYFHIDIAEVQTAEGKLYLFVAIDRTSKFAFAELYGIPPPTAVCPDLLIGVKSMAYVMRYNHFPD